MENSSNYSFRWLLPFLMIGWGIYLYFSGLEITGPFIFGDELTYFSFARSIFQGKSISGFTQYGPLYPLLLSPFFFCKNIIITYHAIRIFNIALFISAVIPAYLLAQSLFSNRWLKVLFTLFVLFTPYSGLVHLIWAEPLYIALFYWSCFLFFLFVKKPTLLKSISLGTFLSSLYYTKPAAGFAVQIAAVLTLALYCLFCPKNKKLISTAILTSFILDLPWVIHYLHIGVSIIGYPSATAEFNSHLAQEGYLTLAATIFRSLFYQFSYFFIGSWGMIGVTIVLLFTKWNHLHQADRNFTIFTLLSIFGLIALCAIGMSSNRYLDFRMAGGRYFSLLLPLITVLTLHLLFEVKSKYKFETLLLSTGIILTTLIAIIASPLYVRNPVAFNSLPDLSPIIYLTDHKKMIWRSLIEKPHHGMKVNVPLIFCIFSLILIYLRKWKHVFIVAAIIILSGTLFGAFTEQYYISHLGRSEFHDIYFYIKNNHIDISQVAFDKKMEEISNAPFLTPFWMDEPSAYLTPKDMTKHNNSSILYFITEDKLALHKVFSSGPYILYTVSK